MNAAEITSAAATPRGIDHEEHSWSLFLSVQAHWVDAAFLFLLLLLMFFCRGWVGRLYAKLPVALIDKCRDLYDGPRSWRDMKTHWAGRPATRYKRDMARAEERKKKKDKKEEKKKQKQAEEDKKKADKDKKMAAKEARRKAKAGPPDLERGYELLDYPLSERRRLALERA